MKKLIPIIVFIIAVIILLYVLFKNKDAVAQSVTKVKEKITGSGSSGSGSSGSGSGSGSTSTADPFPLRRGSKGQEVRNVQTVFNGMITSLQALSKTPLAKLTVDGDFGPKTEAMVKLALQGKTEVSRGDYNTYILPFISK